MEREFERVITLLESHPRVGSTYEALEGVRTCHLRKTPYDVFYEVHDDIQEVHIVAVWSRIRSEDPPVK